MVIIKKNIRFLYRTIKPNYTMARAMYDYTKTILERVSFDPSLFCREVEKAFERLLPYEIEELKIWIRSLILHKPELSQCLVYLRNDKATQ